MDAGTAIRFRVSVAGEARPAFAIRYDGRVYAYINACAHRTVELDWVPGEVFDAEHRYLICATHGARYEPSTGRCVGGPCAGRALAPIVVQEDADSVYLDTRDDLELLQDDEPFTIGNQS